MSSFPGLALDLPEYLQGVTRDVLTHLQAGEYIALLGPHSSGKSDVLEYARTVLGKEGRPCLYVDLKETQELSEAAFFVRLAAVTSKALFEATGLDLPPLDDVLGPSRAYGTALTACVPLLGCDLVLLVDHLETIPNDLARALLESLRVVHQQQAMDDCRLVVVVAGALSLAALAVGVTSPFHNIAHKVIVGDLTAKQNVTLIAGYLRDVGVKASQKATKVLLHAAAGDPGLIRRLCRRCGQTLDNSVGSDRVGARHLTDRTLQRVLREFLAEEAKQYRPLREGIDLIEHDTDLLRSLLLLLRHPQVPRRELPLSLTSDLDPLYLTGFVRSVGDDYQLRNDIYRRYLNSHFDPGRVGHLLTMAGQWDEAMDYLVNSIQSGNEQYRSDLLDAAINSMRAAPDVKAAAHFLARGLADAFGITEACIWQVSGVQAKLRPLWRTDGSAEGNGCIEIRVDEDRLEARAYRQAQPLRGPGGQEHVRRAFPLLATVGEPIGVVTFLDRPGNFPVERRHERDLELQGYLAQAARAFHDVTMRNEQEERQRELAETLRDIATALGETLEPAEVMRSILAQMARVLPFDTASIQLPEPGGLHIMASHNFDKPKKVENIVFSWRDEFPNVRVWRSGKPLRFDDAQGEFQHFKDPYYQVEKVHSWLGVPLLVGGKTIGVITLDSFVPDRYTSVHEQIATIFASTAAVAIRNAGLYDQARRRAADLETLAEVAEELSASVQGRARVLDLLVHSASRITGCDCVVIYPFLPGQMVYDTEHIVAYGLVKPEGFSPGDKTRIEETSLAASVVQHGQLIVRNVDADRDRGLATMPFIVREGVKAFAGISLLAGREALGVIFVNFRQPHEFDDDELDTIRRFANQAAFAILNARLYQRTHDLLQQRIERMRTLQEINNAISSTLDLSATFSMILDRTLKHTVAPYGTIQLVTEDGTALELAVSRGATLAMTGERLPLGEGVTGRAAQENITYCIDDILAPEWTDVYTSYCPNMRSELAVPMQFEGRVVGVINIERSETHAFSEDDQEFVETLARQAAIAINNAIRYQELQQSYQELESTKSSLIASQAVAWLGLFGADWQHTINQKTFSIENYANGLRTWLAERDVDPEVASQVKSALQGIERVVDAIRTVKFTSQVPAGATNQVDAVTLLDDELPRMVARWCAERPDITVECSLGCPGLSARIPSQWLEVAMEKLVHNALKAMPEGGQLSIGTRYSGDKVSVTIKDTGHGIPDYVREDFLRKVINRPIGEYGTGMGALIARFIALSHDGDLDLVASDRDRGTELRMVLPVAPAQAQSGE